MLTVGVRAGHHLEMGEAEEQANHSSPKSRDCTRDHAAGAARRQTTLRCLALALAALLWHASPGL